MQNVTLSLIASDRAETSPSVDKALAVLTRGAAGRAVPARRHRVTARDASTQEGLALIASLLAIKDSAVRQALLDLAATLAAPIET